jgi:L-rhamnose mutarotase
LNEDVYIEYKEGKKKETIVAGFCKRHTELWDKVKKEKKNHYAFQFKILIGREISFFYGFLMGSSPLFLQQQQTGKFKIVAREEHRK